MLPSIAAPTPLFRLGLLFWLRFNSAPFAKKIVNGTIEDLDAALYEEILSKIDYSIYDNKAVIIKGCSKKPVPMRAYILAAHHLQAFARSIMDGEACSAVPLYKSSKK